MTDEQIIELMARTFIDALDHDDFYVDAEGFAANHAVIDGSGDIGKPMRAALTALRSAGMAVVPVEPTEAMKRAANTPIGCRRECYLGNNLAESTYRAMIEAAKDARHD